MLFSIVSYYAIFDSEIIDDIDGTTVEGIEKTRKTQTI